MFSQVRTYVNNEYQKLLIYILESGFKDYGNIEQLKYAKTQNKSRLHVRLSFILYGNEWLSIMPGLKQKQSLTCRTIFYANFNLLIQNFDTLIDRIDIRLSMSRQFILNIAINTISSRLIL